MTPLQEIYDTFLGKMLEDEWGNWTEEEAKLDWYSLLMAAIPLFKFPRKSLKIIDKLFFEV